MTRPGIITMEMTYLFVNLPVVQVCTFRYPFQSRDRVRVKVRGGSSAGRALCIRERELQPGAKRRRTQKIPEKSL